MNSVAKAGSKMNINSTIRMASGYEMPVLGFGVYKTPPNDTARCVTYALKTGYRHIDSASGYRNEAACTQALLASGLPRSSYFFTSKIHPREISYEGTKKQINETFKQCEGIEYLDLMLLHAPFGGKANRLGAWDALTEAVEAGKIRSIGVSNYGVHHLDELQAHIEEREAAAGGKKGAGGILSVNQIELHPWLARPDIVSWCRAHDVVCQAYSPLARMTRVDDKRLKAVCERTGRSESQVMIRWSLEMGFVPLPKSVTEERIKANAEVFGWELSDKDVMELDTGEYSPSAWDPTTSRE